MRLFASPNALTVVLSVLKFDMLKVFSAAWSLTAVAALCSTVKVSLNALVKVPRSEAICLGSQ